MLRKTLYLIILLPILIVSSSQPDDIIGYWMVSKKDTIIKIYKYQNDYYGRITWYLPSDDKTKNITKDINNPNPKLRERLLSEVNILSGFKFNGEKWDNGRVYDARSGKYYDCFIQKLSKDKIRIKAYYMFEFFGLSDEWTRVSYSVPPDFE